MDPAEAAEWEALNERIVAGREARASSPCEDCTVRFAVEMRLIGRCDGWPEVRLEGRPWAPVSDSGQARRRRQWREAQGRRRLRQRVTA